MNFHAPCPNLILMWSHSVMAAVALLTHKLLQSGVFDVLKNELLDQQHDGASFELNGRVAFSSDSYVIACIFPGGNIGELAINGTVNDLAMCGSYS